MPGTKVLLVDDSKVLRRLASMTLASMGGYEVDEAADAVEALELMAEKDFDVIITDYYMPGIDGIEFVRRVRARKETATVPVLLVTSERDPFLEAEALAVGVDRMLLKPLNPNQLALALDECVTRRRQVSSNPLAPSVQQILDSFPYPVTILDAARFVVLGNSAFWEQSGSGLDDDGVRCAAVMHASGTPPRDCPLVECVRTGRPVVRRQIESSSIRIVSVFPLPADGADRAQLFLHLARDED